MLAGAAHQDEQNWERTAWLASHVINISGKMVKNPVTPDRLLGRQPPARIGFPMTPEQKFKELVRRQEELQKRRMEAEPVDEE